MQFDDKSFKLDLLLQLLLTQDSYFGGNIMKIEIFNFLKSKHESLYLTYGINSKVESQI